VDDLHSNVDELGREAPIQMDEVTENLD